MLGFYISTCHLLQHSQQLCINLIYLHLTYKTNTYVVFGI